MKNLPSLSKYIKTKENMLEIYYKQSSHIHLTDEQLSQIVISLRGHKIYKYSKKCKEFYLGHVIAQAVELGMADIPVNYEIPDSSMLYVEEVKGNIEYNIYD